MAPDGNTLPILPKYDNAILQVFWSPVDTKEDQKLVELFPASTNGENAKWRQSLVQIPAYKPTEGEVIIDIFKIIFKNGFFN